MTGVPLWVLSAVREQAGGGWELGLSWKTRSWKLLRGQGQALIAEGQGDGKKLLDNFSGSSLNFCRQREF